MSVSRRALLASCVGLAGTPACAVAQGARSLDPEAPGNAALLDRLRRGGLVLFIRHADTAGENCDRTFRIGERAGQRNISPAGRAQAGQLGGRIAALGIPVAYPVLAGPVFRARDTAELAFGAERVSVIDGLLADDYADGRLDWVLSEHRRLLAAPVAAGGNRVLVGHRGPVQMFLGEMVQGTRLPEGSAVVLEPRGAAGHAVLCVLALVPPIDGGNPGCR